MCTRNTEVIAQILDVLHINEPQSLAKLEERFNDSLLVVAGDIETVAKHAAELRLAITTEECALVLDHLAPRFRISIDEVEEVINTLFPDRFIEP